MLWYVLPFVLVLIVIVIWLSRRGWRYRLSTIHVPIESLLKRGYDCGFLIIHISFSRRFLQLRKYIRSPGDYGVELGFPNAKWSSRYFHRVEALCKENAIEFRIERKAIDSPLEFLCVDFGKDHRAATQCVKLILIKIFGVTERHKLFCMLHDSSFEDVLIDR